MEALATAAAGMVTLAVAAWTLAVSKDHVRRLLDARLISGRRSPGALWTISVDTVKGLLWRLAANVRPTITASLKLPFESIVSALGKRGTTSAEVVATAADGRVPIIGIDNVHSSLKHLRLACRPTAAVDDGTVRTLARQLDVK